MDVENAIPAESKEILAFLKDKIGAQDYETVAKMLAGGMPDDETGVDPRKDGTVTGAADSRHRGSFASRFPEVARVRSL